MDTFCATNTVEVPAIKGPIVNVVLISDLLKDARDFDSRDILFHTIS